MSDVIDLIQSTGFFFLDWKMVVMWGVVALLLYLAVAKGFEPLLLVPIAFGALLANLPTAGILNQPAEDVVAPVAGQIVEVRVLPGQEVEPDGFASDSEERRPVLLLIRPTEPTVQGDPGNIAPGTGAVYEVRDDGLVAVRLKSGAQVRTVDVQVGDEVAPGQQLLGLRATHPGGLYHYFYLGILLELFPPLIFLGVGALTDFGPLIANPRTLLLGAAAQFGVFATFLGASAIGFNPLEAASIGIIGGADGPTSIFIANALAPHLLGPIAVAAYTYMSLVPILQPPIMRALTTQKERRIRMKSLRPVRKTEKLIFAVMVMVLSILLVPSAAPLVFMLFLGNFLRECGVTERLSKSAQNEIINIVTIFLGTSVGITMTGDAFLNPQTLGILAMGVVAFGVATATGVLMAKGMNLFAGANPINPLIGSAGVSAVPMAARVSQVEGQKADNSNFLLMHAMGPNVAGVIGTALVAGYFIATLSGS